MAKAKDLQRHFDQLNKIQERKSPDRPQLLDKGVYTNLSVDDNEKLAEIILEQLALDSVVEVILKTVSIRWDNEQITGGEAESFENTLGRIRTRVLLDQN